MKRRTVIITTISLGALSGCSSSASEPPKVSNGTLEQCEKAYLEERNSGNPDPSVVSPEIDGDWRKYTIVSEWADTHRDSDGNEVVVDHYKKAYYHVGDDEVYRTDEAESDPKRGQQMDC